MTIQTDVRFVGHVFQVDVLDVRLPDGSVGRREIVRHGGGAAVVAIDGLGRIVLVRQYRKAVEMEMLEIPAGKLEPGEDPAACAARELREETGFQAEGIFPLISILPTPGYCSEVLHLFFATHLTAGESRPDEGEFVETVLLPMDVCMEMIGDGRIRDAKTVAGILLAAGKAECRGAL